MNTTPDYYSRKPLSRTFPHVGDRSYKADCLCPACLAEYRRNHPEEYAVPQAAPMQGARVNDFTNGTYQAAMKVMSTLAASAYNAPVDSKEFVKVKGAPRKAQYAAPALILNV